MKIYDLFPSKLLSSMLEEGYVRTVTYESAGLTIYNYTEKAQYGKVWNTVTTTCRGLIVDFLTLDIVARPFPKFFNYGEHWSSELIRDDEPVVAMDKMDGSLGIMYKPSKTTGMDFPLIATRGSFLSQQAMQGSYILRNKYSHFQPPEGKTLLFEIIYPDNRIVVDYGDITDLYLLGAVDIETGVIYGPEMVPEWPGPRVPYIPVGTMREALSFPPRPGKEGIVVRLLSDDMMVKIKQEDYIKTHRIVTGLNKRVVWERLKNGEDVYKDVPNEFHEWITDIAEELSSKHAKLMDSAKHLFNFTMGGLDYKAGGVNKWSRKDFALAVRQYPDRFVQKILFLLLDKQDPSEYIWNHIKPTGEDKKDV